MLPLDRSNQISKQPTPTDRLMQFMFGFAPTLILEAALKHRIFDVLNDTPKTVLNE